MAVIKNAGGATDVWVYDVASGSSTRITAGGPHTTPVWSPDGKQIAYVSVFSDEGYSAIYRKAADGSGAEELVYRHPPGTAASLTDWSAQGLLCFWAGDVMYALAVDGDRKASEMLHEKYTARAGRFSPDGRYIAFSSNESGRFEVYVAPVRGASLAGKPVQVSNAGALGATLWRQDGKELYFITLVGLAPGPEMVAEISTDPELKAGAPRALFRPGGVTSPGQLSSIATRDGERFVFLIQAPAAR